MPFQGISNPCTLIRKPIQNVSCLSVNGVVDLERYVKVLKSVLATKVTEFIDRFRVKLENHYGGGCVIKATSGKKLIFSGFVRVS